MFGIRIANNRPTRCELAFYNNVERHISDFLWWISPTRLKAGLPFFRSGPITQEVFAWARATALRIAQADAVRERMIAAHTNGLKPEDQERVSDG